MPKPHSFFLPESYPDPLPTPDAPTADAPNPHPDLLPDSLFAPGVVRFASFNNLYNSLTRHLIQIQDSVGTKNHPKTKT